MQAAGGRKFVHEHSAGHSSWGLPCMQQALNIQDTVRVNGQTRRRGKGEKHIGYITNSLVIAKKLEAQRDKEHDIDAQIR